MEYLNNLILETKDSNMLNPFKYLSFIAVANHFIYKYNSYYCYNKPFTTYFNKFQMDTTSVKNLKILRNSIILIPLYAYYLRKANEQKIKELSASETSMYYVKELSKDIILPLSISFAYSSLLLPLFSKSKSYSSSKYLYLASIFVVYSIGFSNSSFISQIILPQSKNTKEQSDTRVLA
jgi:hypothetical protein